jgi:hypothetical protein
MRGSTFFGHYVCYARCLPPSRDATEDYGDAEGHGQWFCYDDSRVTAVTWDQVAEQNAYLLFYSRVRGSGAGSIDCVVLNELVLRNAFFLQVINQILEQMNR